MANLTTVKKDKDGRTTIRCGALTIIVPTEMGVEYRGIHSTSGADERAEIRCNGSRVFVEAHDNGPLISAVEYYKDLVH